MKLRRSITAIAFCLAAMPVRAGDGPVRLYAPPVLVETGVFQYVLPRFSLKTQVRVELVEDPGAAQVVTPGKAACHSLRYA